MFGLVKDSWVLILLQHSVWCNIPHPSASGKFSCNLMREGEWKKQVMKTAGTWHMKVSPSPYLENLCPHWSHNTYSRSLSAAPAGFTLGGGPRPFFNVTSSRSTLWLGTPPPTHRRQKFSASLNSKSPLFLHLACYSSLSSWHETHLWSHLSPLL